jgi:hypothetical protein
MGLTRENLEKQHWIAYVVIRGVAVHIHDQILFDSLSFTSVSKICSPVLDHLCP